MQRASVLALQAMLRLCCAMEGEERAVERLVALNVLPTLARALQNPEERQFYEKSFSLLLKS